MAGKASTRTDVLHLTIANAIESGLRLLIPIFLVRLIDQEQFGAYRLFWLMANTLALFIPLGMSRSLLYFLPRSEPDERARFISQTVIYLSAMTLPVAVVLVLFPDWIPDRVTNLTDPVWILGVFMFLWTVSSLILTLPNADQRIIWQKWVIIGLSVARAIMVLGTAILTESLQEIFIALLAFSALQMAVLTFYVAKNYGLKLKMPTASGFMKQMRYAIPFGLSGILTRARGQIEQWIVAAMFLPAALAIFSISHAFNGILKLLRHSVGSVLLPKMSSTHAAGDIKRSLELNNRGNLAICFLIFPCVAFIWTYAAEMIEFLFTEDYLEAVPLVRVYSLTMILMSVELATVLMIFEQGKFVAKVSGGVLIAAVILSYLGATNFGLIGVAAGSVTGTLINRLINYKRAAKVLEVPFSRLQDWSTLGKLLIAAMLSGIASLYLVSFLDGDTNLFAKLLLAGSSGGLVYLSLIFVFRVDWVMRCLLGTQQWPSR